MGKLESDEDYILKLIVNVFMTVRFLIVVILAFLALKYNWFSMLPAAWIIFFLFIDYSGPGLFINQDNTLASNCYIMIFHNFHSYNNF